MVRNHDQNSKEIWDIIKRPNLRLIGIDEGMEIKTKGVHNLFNDIISENFPNLKNEMENQLQEAYRTPNVQNYSRSTPKYIIMRMTKIQNKDKLKGHERKKSKLCIRENQFRSQLISQPRPLKARRSWNNIFQTLKENGCQARILYPEKLFQI